MKRIIALILLASSVAIAAPGPQPEVRQGKASWYGYEWTTGKRGTMANGKRFNPRAWSAATYDYPLGSVIEVTNKKNGKVIAVVVTDRGPARRLHRLIDLSEAAATALGYHKDGITIVSVRVLVARGGNSL